MARPDSSFVSEMTVERALALHPKARWVFAAYHLMSCSSCGRARDETLQELAGNYRLELDALLADLNSLVEHA
ncbi:MAG TPA: disulfide oxidoreductase [Thermoanaerobaculia bacterium]|jgi:hypothetical protein|nr:disulfide oxidoreductase [Thermoanaerobaculia bacterium]